MSETKFFYLNPEHGKAPVRTCNYFGQILFRVRDVEQCFRLSAFEWIPNYSHEARSIKADGRDTLFVTAAGLISMIPPGPEFYRLRQMAVELILAGQEELSRKKSG